MPRRRSVASIFPALLHAAATAILSWSLLVPVVGHAQSLESELPPLPGEFKYRAPAAREIPYAIPDVSEAMVRETQVQERWLTLKIGFVSLYDFTTFSQDSDSIAQVGRQDDDGEVRAARLVLRGTLGNAHRVQYLLAAEYKGFDQEPGDTWSIADFSFTFPLGTEATRLTVGKSKETFAYEMVGSSANLPQMERVLNPFFVSRNIGVKLDQVLGPEHRATASIGIFSNDWGGEGSGASTTTDVTGRLTRLLWSSNEDTSFLHLGASFRYVTPNEDVLQYKGRPETNVSDNFVDTGAFEADHALHFAVEMLWNKGPYSVLAEYNQASVDAPVSGDPRFFGYYVTGSWVLTGETRPYDRTTAYAKRIMPDGRWGAPELVVRYSHVDLNGGNIEGGSFDKVYIGINWWATRRWKAGLGWGRTWLDRFDTDGTTNSLLTRLQWVF
jgi:phosphate-selective porin OprO/OprP